MKAFVVACLLSVSEGFIVAGPKVFRHVRQQQVRHGGGVNMNAVSPTFGRRSFMFGAIGGVLLPSAPVGAFCEYCNYQSEDKSMEFTVPDIEQWNRPSPAAGKSSHLQEVLFEEPGTSCRVEATVDLNTKFGKSLAEYAKVDQAADRFMATLQGSPGVVSSSLLSAEKVPGPLRGSTHYQFKYLVTDASGEKQGIATMDVKQNRRYTITVAAPTKMWDSPKVQSWADTISNSFTANPINFICMGQSNSGNPIVPGSCY